MAWRTGSANGGARSPRWKRCWRLSAEHDTKLDSKIERGDQEVGDGGVHFSTSESYRRRQRSYMNEGNLVYFPIKGFIETSFLDWKDHLSSVLFTGGCNF